MAKGRDIRTCYCSNRYVVLLPLYYPINEEGLALADRSCSPLYFPANSCRTFQRICEPLGSHAETHVSGFSGVTLQACDGYFFDQTQTRAMKCKKSKDNWDGRRQFGGKPHLSTRGPHMSAIDTEVRAAVKV